MERQHRVTLGTARVGFAARRLKEANLRLEKDIEFESKNSIFLLIFSLEIGTAWKSGYNPTEKRPHHSTNLECLQIDVGYLTYPFDLEQ